MADEGGTVLFGGQFDKCKLLFGNSIALDECGNKGNSKQEHYSGSSFDIFWNISTIQ